MRDGVPAVLALGPGGTAAHSLLFRPLSETGDEVFVDAIASTYERTRNSWITESIREHGTLGAARADFQDYQRLDFEPDWWELAYTESGALAGVIRAKPGQMQELPDLTRNESRGSRAFEELALPRPHDADRHVSGQVRRTTSAPRL